jgi:hypothetical protein
MKKNRIIIYSALLIAGFGLLFYLEKPEAVPGSEVKDFIRNYEGRKGFAIVKMPEFLMGQVLPHDSTGIEKENFHAFRMMFFHQKESEQYNCQETHQAMVHFLDSLKFSRVMENQQGHHQVEVYQKPRNETWNEHVTLYSSDSTLFIFNYINNLDQEQAVAFSRNLNYQDFL